MTRTYAVKYKSKSKMLTTSSEEDAIRQKDPKAYMEYKAARMEQEAYERRLERCKTKEEAQR